MTGFHAAFDRALTGDLDTLGPHLEPGDRTLGALAVYRNTTIKARIDALEANYPTVLQMVGEDWFRAAAAAFVAEQPGDRPVLVDYGAGFPDWLARFEPARDMTYLAPCARLDRAWTQAHLAKDAVSFEAREAAALGSALAGATAALHPSVQLFWFEWTAPSLWLAHRYPSPDASLEWRAEAEGLLVHRSGAEVQARLLSRAEWVFLDACRLYRPFGVAAAAAQAAAPGLDLSAFFAALIALGVFTSPSIPKDRS
ncbi:MAG: DNA-binding domain-containing protein [Brevundimonas sp.]|uniref:HvfC/BufC N-terminal domain-containing protein n=1 Tax=Brevundimonas sp. TaxID=1871086 RepID=UPI00255FBDB3|nr:DNA-binding domain-containing protein [Brevundimonas sp.]MDK2746927.1 DNA-binding domain-containing protein [Brevundimonas sp.]